MRVEPCCQALLQALLPEIDPQRQGVCLDVGVGTFAFYCELFAQLGFSAIAVEPLPVKTLYSLAAQKKITLLPLALSDQDGEQTLYVGRFAGLFNRNFSSLSPQWFGASTQGKTIQTLTLPSLLAQERITRITCLKLDIEGWEWKIIQQLALIDREQLPAVVMFEYGGGSNRQRGKQGWAPAFFEQTLQSLNLLQSLGYASGLLIDMAPDRQEVLFNLQDLDPSHLETLFPPDSIYGNILLFRDYTPDPPALAAICRPYYAMTWIESWVSRWVSR